MFISTKTCFCQHCLNCVWIQTSKIPFLLAALHWRDSKPRGISPPGLAHASTSPGNYGQLSLRWRGHEVEPQQLVGAHALLPLQMIKKHDAQGSPVVIFDISSIFVAKAHRMTRSDLWSACRAAPRDHKWSWWDLPRCHSSHWSLPRCRHEFALEVRQWPSARSHRHFSHLERETEGRKPSDPTDRNSLHESCWK